MLAAEVVNAGLAEAFSKFVLFTSDVKIKLDTCGYGLCGKGLDGLCAAGHHAADKIQGVAGWQVG